MNVQVLIEWSQKTLEIVSRLIDTSRPYFHCFLLCLSNYYPASRVSFNLPPTEKGKKTLPNPCRFFEVPIAQESGLFRTRFASDKPVFVRAANFLIWRKPLTKPAPTSKIWRQSFEKLSQTYSVCLLNNKEQSLNSFVDKILLYLCRPDTANRWFTNLQFQLSTSYRTFTSSRIEFSRIVHFY